MQRGNVLEILIRHRETLAATVPEELIRLIYEMEERLQFDADRPEATTKIRRAVEATILSESLKGGS